MLVTQSCLTLCDTMDCNPPDSSVHGILQARTLEWVAMPFSRESPKDPTKSYYIWMAVLSFWGLPRWLSGKDCTCQGEDTGSIPGSRRSSGEGHGIPLQYSCLEQTWREDPGRLHSMVSQKSQTLLVTKERQQQATIFFFLPDCSA